MLHELSLNSKYFYHNLLSFFMLGVWAYVGFKGFALSDDRIKRKMSFYIIFYCIIQELIDFINRIFLDSNYLFSFYGDIPFLQFCQISFYFSLLCILYSKKSMSQSSKYSMNQFFFDCAFLLGFSGAFQGIITPDFLNINNLIGVICIQLQHSLIILNLIWLLTAYKYRLRFIGVCLTYLFINIIAPLALWFNNILGEPANYFYVIELPKIDNFFLNFVSQHPSPHYILYIQPVFIVYFLALYIPFYILSKRNL